MKKNHEVIVFTAGLMHDPTPLVDHVYQMFIDMWVHNMRRDNGIDFYASTSLFLSGVQNHRRSIRGGGIIASIIYLNLELLY